MIKPTDIYRYDMFKLFCLGFMFLLMTRPSVQQVMEYLGYVSGSTNEIGKRVQEAQPILESFGNAVRKCHWACDMARE